MAMMLGAGRRTFRVQAVQQVLVPLGHGLAAAPQRGRAQGGIDPKTGLPFGGKNSRFLANLAIPGKNPRFLAGIAIPDNMSRVLAAFRGFWRNFDAEVAMHRREPPLMTIHQLFRR